MEVVCLGCDKEFKPRSAISRPKPICGSCRKVYRLTVRAERRYRRMLLERNIESLAEQETKDYDKGNVLTPVMAERVIEWLGR